MWILSIIPVVTCSHFHVAYVMHASKTKMQPSAVSVTPRHFSCEADLSEMGWL